MANQRQLAILKQGVDVWNKWRIEHPDADIDLSFAQLYEADLREANLSRAKLINADLREANLLEADLNGANLSNANLNGAYLCEADLRYADLSRADLNEADLNKANLNGANLNGADLNGANLTRANLTRADLNGADLNEVSLCGVDLSNAKFIRADLSRAIIGHTFFGDRDFRQIKGLASVKHLSSSPLTINSIYLSEGDIPEVFVRGTGAPDTFIEYMHALAAKPIDYYTCFISYSSKDHAFAERLHADLQAKGVRCWFAPEDLKIGEKFWHRIDESIRLYDKLLVVLSQHSVASTWVENEVMAALEKEQKQSGKPVLFPIKLDEAVMETDLPWAANIRRTRHIGDFTKWKQHDPYQKALERLLRDLQPGG